MPESQFGSSPGSLTATLDELVAFARHLRATPVDIPSRLTRLEGLTQLLSYFTSPPAVTRDNSQPSRLVTTHCAFDACTRTWRDYDACLLNFAKRDEPPLWLCRDHHPPSDNGGIRPPGYQTDMLARAALEEARKAVRDKLSPAELVIINSCLKGAY